MKRNQLLLFFGLLIIFLLFFIIAIIVTKEKITPPELKPVAPAPEDIPVAKKEVRLFLLEENGSIRKEDLKIQAGSNFNETLKNFLDLLLATKNRPATPLPEGTDLHSFFYLKEKNLLVLDFNGAMIENFPPGTEAELEYIYFIINNICFNFPQIKQVQFLFDGKELSAITGHLDIETPFLPDFTKFQNEQ